MTMKKGWNLEEHVALGCINPRGMIKVTGPSGSLEKLANAMDAMELESSLIPPPWSQELIDKFPKEFQQELLDPSQAGGPIGVGFREDVGHFILGCGQGPFIIWIEK
jgi:hypothetical protein